MTKTETETTKFGLETYSPASLYTRRTEILPLATSHLAIAHLCNQFNHVFALLISIPDSRALTFIKIGLNLSYFAKNFKIFESSPETAPSFQISGYVPESNYVLPRQISLPPDFSLMPRRKSINFYQNNPKIKLFCKTKIFLRVLGALIPDPNGLRRSSQTLRTQSLSPLQNSGYAPDPRRVLLILPSFRFLQWEIIKLANNNRYLQKWSSSAIFQL